MATNEVCRAYETKATRSGWEQYLVSFGSPLVLLTSQNDVGRAVTDCAIRFSLRSNQSELHTRRRTAGSLLKFSNMCGRRYAGLRTLSMKSRQIIHKMSSNPAGHQGSRP